ncbi:MAG: glutaredoxin family protein [Woeseiaceae bacterium]
MTLQTESPADTITVYSRAGCHLCELLVDALLPLVRGQLRVDVVDIDSRPEWQEAYDTRIPVVEYDSNFVCQYTLDVAAIQRILRERVIR